MHVWMVEVDVEDFGFMPLTFGLTRREGRAKLNENRQSFVNDGFPKVRMRLRKYVCVED